MKATGTVRRIDHLGRVVIPSEIRATQHLCNGDTVEFYTDGGAIIMKKFDAVVDVEQLISSFERSIQAGEILLPQVTADALLAKVKEMKAIAADSRNRQEELV